MTRTLLSAAAALSLLSAGAPAALAQHRAMPATPLEKDVIIHGTDPVTHKEVASKVVKFDDLDISTSAGADTLLRRIRAASKTVCGPRNMGKRSMRDKKDHDECLSEATAQAVQNLNAPKVSEAYKAQSD